MVGSCYFGLYLNYLGVTESSDPTRLKSGVMDFSAMINLIDCFHSDKLLGRAGFEVLFVS